MFQVQKFEFCKGEFRKGTKWTELEDNEIMRSWVTRRSVFIKEQLPNILKWSQITTISDAVSLLLTKFVCFLVMILEYFIFAVKIAKRTRDIFCCRKGYVAYLDCGQNSVVVKLSFSYLSNVVNW